MATSEAQHQRLSKRKALATFSSDPLSSVAYATEEILLVLVLAGSSALHLALPISLSIVTLLIVVVLSYRQTIFEYPGGGGAYTVAHDNLGRGAGLTAAAALLTDYVLTVAVSVAAGMAALTSAFPVLQEHRTALCLGAIAFLSLMNLRGIRESSTVFAIPTYAFILSVLTMLGLGAWRLFTGEFTHENLPTIPMQQELGIFLVLRAFSSGCTALTGVEAVSNGVPLFHKPEARNASRTLIGMVCILAMMFTGITYLAHYHGIVPSPSETVISQLARSIFHQGFAYYFLQLSTMGILVLAANTAYADFPRLASILARDRYLPRQLNSLGDRLVFSNGIVLLSLASAFLILAFQANTHALIPLYAVGVFLSFTLSQAGMVRHWFKGRQQGWELKAALNLFGGLLTGIVTIVITITKFTHGAWIITLVIPAFIYMFTRIQAHYLSVGRQLSLAGEVPSLSGEKIPTHELLIPVSGLHRGVLAALKYARSISSAQGSHVRAVYVNLEAEATGRMQAEWGRWGDGIPLLVLDSHYRSVITPLLEYVDELQASQPGIWITVLIPEFVTARWWEGIFHNQTALLIRTALLFRKNVVVTSVRYHLG